MMRFLQPTLVILLVVTLVYSPAFAFLTRSKTNFPVQQSPAKEETVQKRDLPPHKDLPLPQDLLDEGKGTKKTKAKDAPLKPATLCRHRDVLCLEEQRKNGGKISANTPQGSQTEQSQTASATKPEGNWFKRVGKKISGALSGASALVNTPSMGNSFMPTTAAPATSAPPPPPPPPSFSTLNDAKLDPHNRIGTGSEDMFSGNYHWSTPLVSLPGRGGLDLNLTLHYNSLNWVRFGSTMYYDPDWRTSYAYGLANGFNMGFPEIESGYSYDGATAWAVTLPSGYRVPMRRLGTSSRFQAADGSNLYLVSTGVPVLYAPDGTQYTYGTTSPLTWNGYRCTQVRDSNGNRINITYNSTGLLSTITDTLGRVLTFNYTGYQLLTITQNWFGVSKVLAQFDYSNLTLNYNFSSVPNLVIDGPASGSTIPVLTRVITSDGARHVFVYNGWGLVDDIFLYGASDNQRTAMDYGFPSTNTALDDCPRFSQRNDGIWGFNGQWNSNLGWVANYFQFAPNETWGQITTPDGVVHKELFSATGNTRGLSTGMETIVSGIKRKWTTTAWASDGTSRPRYPRVTETNIFDDVNGDNIADNQRRTTIDYSLYSAGGTTMPYTVYLPFGTNEYAANATTVYRRSETDYMNQSDYWTRWIVGLPIEQRLYEGTTTLQARTTYWYDDYLTLTHPTAISQHDTAAYGQYAYYRGNLTSSRRYNVSTGAYTETQSEYYVTGNVAKSRNALGHETKFFYDDAFATYADDASNTEAQVNLGVKTWAYPTQIQDPQNFSSYVKYWFDTGAPTRTTDPKGAAAISIYETTYGQLAKSKNMVNGAYTRYVYDPGHTWVQTWSTINDTTESAVLNLLDGIGRVRQRIDEHPGTAGTLSSSYKVYDFVGRIVEWSNPTEISSATWVPTGDDTAYVYSRQDYDWNHRPTITYNQDYNASTNPNSKQTISYTGCGCAGGAITTVTDEMGRARKSYADFLGRTYKTEIMNGASVYSSVQSTFNARDQVTNITEYAGAVGSGGATQQTTMEYDGYGQLWKRKRPQESGDTIFTYNANGQVLSSTDARGATGTLTYNARGLMTQATYTKPAGSNIVDTPTVTFQYDAAGNRTEMDDGPGKVTYERDTLSRITKETRTFDELPGKSFQLQYEYNLSGQVTKLTDPANDFINYSYDKTGRMTSITGSPYGGVTQYATGISYRAWNVSKAAAYGNGFAASAKFTPRLQVKEFDIPGVIGGTYAYNLDGQLNSFTSSTPQSSDYDWRMGRTFTYDAIGRMNGSSGTVGANFPYAYNPTYNEFGNVTSSSYLYWQSGNTNVTFNATYQNNRVLTASDAGQSQTWNYDAMGNRTSLVQNGTTIENISINVLGLAVNSPIDGEGQPIKLVSDFYVRSTVLGGAIITQLDYAGVKSKTRVHDGGSLLAEQVVTATGNEVLWHHRDPLNVVARDTKAGQVKRKTFAINPVGAQIESTEGVNIGQYYACLYGGQNNPGCTGYSPQPPGNYGPAANAANGQFAASIKVDGALTLRSLGDILAQAQRAGIAVDLWISPALSGTPITQGIDGGVIRRSVAGWKEVAGHVTKNGKYERDFVETILDAWQFVPGGNAAGAFQQPQRPQRRREREAPQPDQPAQPPRQIDCNNLLLVPLDGNARYTLMPNNPHVVALFHPDFANALNRAIGELNRAGIVPQINSGYRTAAEQQRMRNGAAGANPAAQGTSLHQTGYAVDINGVRGINGQSILNAMSAQGMTRVANDPPHFENNAFGPRGARDSEQRRIWRARVRQAADNAEAYYNQCIMGQAVTVR